MGVPRSGGGKGGFIMLVSLDVAFVTHAWAVTSDDAGVRRLYKIVHKHSEWGNTGGKRKARKNSPFRRRREGDRRRGNSHGDFRCRAGLGEETMAGGPRRKKTLE